MTSCDVKSYDLTNEIILRVYFVGEASTRHKTSFDVMLYDQIWNMCSVSKQWGMNTFQRGQSSALEGRIKEYTLNCACYKIKCMKFSNKDIQSLSGCCQLVSFFLFHKSHTTYFCFFFYRFSQGFQFFRPGFNVVFGKAELARSRNLNCRILYIFAYFTPVLTLTSSS